MVWWIWLLTGIVLCILEVVLTPGVFVLLFFGLSSFVVGALESVGIARPFWVQIVILSVLSVVFLILFRRRMLERLGMRNAKLDLDSVVGGTAIAAQSIAPGETGKVDFRGTSWNAQNCGSETISQGQQCSIEKVDGLLLSVR